MTTNRTSPIKRKRRTKAEIEELQGHLYAILAEEHPATVRQVFYQAVTRGLIDKTEAEYKNVVCRHLGTMRLQKQLPWGWIADNTRWMRKPDSFSTLKGAIESTARTYRRALWDNQGVRVEVWLEKDALSGVLYRETGQWDVPLMVTRGYPSLSFLCGAAEEIEYSDKPTHIYYFGDHDPSGRDISRNVEERLREFAPDAEIYFERVAVEPWQIQAWDLPERPTKRTDSRAKGFEGGSVEVDAIAPGQLRELVSECIQQHVDEDALQVLQVAEQSERQALRMMGQQL